MILFRDAYLIFATYIITLCGPVGVKSIFLSTRVVYTKYGNLQGFIAKPQNKALGNVEIFLGVPYAAPPVGPLRFMPPKPPLLWQGTKTCITMPQVCPQKLPDVSNRREALKRMPEGRYQYLQRLIPLLRNYSEDCLYLNIYVPYRGKYTIYLNYSIQK